MPSLFTHLFVGGTLGTLGPTSPYSGRILVGAALCSALPDADAIGFWLGIPYNSVLGHRGISHSLVAAIIIGCCATSVIYRRLPDRRSLPTVAILTLATASHGLLDALTNGGLGIAFFAPFVNDRCFFFPGARSRLPPLVSGVSSPHEALMCF